MSVKRIKIKNEIKNVMAFCLMNCIESPAIFYVGKEKKRRGNERFGYNYF